MGIIVAGDTNIGLKRSTNQDAIAIRDDLLFYAVADGMGGHQGGDVASKLAVELAPKFMKKMLQDESKSLLQTVVNKVNQEIYKTAQKNPGLEGMGTTVVSLFFRGNTVYVTNVGDSRAYLISNGEIFQLTRDHSLIQEKVYLGLYTREQAQQDRMKNILVRTLGFEPDVEADIFSYKVSRNDIFLLCSDGLHGKLHDRDIVKVANSFIPDPQTVTEQDLSELVDQYIALANSQGGQDNISVIVAVAQ